MEPVLQHILTPTHLVILMHMANPEIEVGAPFSYMMPVLVLISAPISSRNTIADLVLPQRWALRLGGMASIVAALLAFTPLGDLVFEKIMNTPETE